MERKELILLIFIVTISGIFVNITAVTSNPKQEKIFIIIDTDVAPDDIGAILYLLKHPQISIRGITVSCGITYIESGVNNILQLLDYLGISDIPVAGGKTTPLLTNHSFPTLWREGSLNFFGLNLPSTDLQPSELNATELIVDLINVSTENTTLITLGPLTNIAKAIQSDPSIMEKIELIDIMGGAVNVPGNVGYEDPSISNYVTEWNMYIDPHAADMVFKSGIPIMLVPLDATSKVPVTENFSTTLGNVKTTPEANIVHQLLTPGLYFWDQLTAVALTDPAIVTLEPHRIEIVIDPQNQTGRTKSVIGESNAQIASDANAPQFENRFIEIINQEETTTTSETFTTSITTRDSHIEILPILFSILVLVKIQKK